MSVINQGLTKLVQILDQLPSALSDYVNIEILTESVDDQHNLNLDDNSGTSIRFRIIPQEYATQNNTKLKARALHFAVESRSTELTSDELSNLYIIHFDAESEININGLISIIDSIYNQPSKLILQGPIFYPNFWFNANILSRQMESLRPWNCHECYTNTVKGYPYHLHGSNIVIRADIEQSVGWDFGKVLSYPVVAEDLFFGIKAYLLYGEEIFGWHGGVVKEQPAFHVRDSLDQRIRWIRGTLQALEVVPTWLEYKNLENRKKYQFKIKIYFKLFFYSLGFFPAIIALGGLGLLLLVSVLDFSHIFSNGMSSGEVNAYIHETFMPMIPPWMLNLSMVGALLWLTTIQIGLYHNLKYKNLRFQSRITEHLKVLLITPLATVLDTGVVFFTTLTWFFGYKKATWRVTPKQPFVH